MAEATWTGVLCPEGVESGDGRMFAADGLTWRDLPIPLRWQEADIGGHDGAVVVARIDEIWREPNGDGTLIKAKGAWHNTEAAQAARALYDGGFSRGISVDVDAGEIELVDPETGQPIEADGDILDDPHGAVLMVVTKGRIAAATLVAIPAFQEAMVTESTPLEPVTASVLTFHYNPAQARVPAGNRGGGRWLDTPTAVARSLSRLTLGRDVGIEATDDLAGSLAERRAKASAILAREGRPSLEEMADRVGQMYDLTTPAQREAGARWYNEANGLAREMAAGSNGQVSVEQAAAVIAHCSTQTFWDQNVVMARAIVAGGSMDDVVTAVNTAAEGGHIARRSMVLSRNVEKARSALGTADPIGTNDTGTFSEGSNKTRTFAANIMGDQDGVTIDTWMYRVLGQTDEIRGKVKGLPQATRKDQVYEALAEPVRMAAEARGISPAEMQATTWGWMQTAYRPERQGHPARVVYTDPDGVEREFPVVLPGTAPAAVAAAALPLPDVGPAPVGDEVEYLDDGQEIDYFRVQAYRLLGIDVSTDPVTAGALLRFYNERQARIPRGNTAGGQWMDTPTTVGGSLSDAIAGFISGRGGGPDAGSGGEADRPETPTVNTLARAAIEGGFTVRTNDLTNVAHGFAVARSGSSSIRPATTQSDAADQILGYLREHPDAPNIGGWMDTEHHEICLDVVDIVADRDEAIRRGREQNQIAIFDLDALEEISTGGTGDQPTERAAAAGAADAYRHRAAPRGSPGQLGRHVARGAARVGDGHGRHDGLPREHRAARRADRVGAFAYNPAQARIPRGNRGGGQWIDTPGGAVRGDLVAARDAFGGTGGDGDGGGAGGGDGELRERLAGPISEGAREDFAQSDCSASDHLVHAEDGSVTFSADRVAQHEQMVAQRFEGTAPAEGRGRFNLLGGGPAAGKSVFVRENPDEFAGMATINADDYKMGEAGTGLVDITDIPAGRKPAAWTHEESSYLAKESLEHGYANNISMTLDGTGDNTASSVRSKMQQARDAGYEVHGYYVTCPTDVAIARAAQREAATGRGVAEEVVRKTHDRVSQVFPRVANDFDTVRLVDTETNTLIGEKRAGGTFTVYDSEGWSRFLAKATEHDPDTDAGPVPTFPTAPPPAA
ncbi:MAG: zeta toxin family protein [Promicromonosporaceae bacterium]|nr:zeta toxin family protein [Promicromonosporaceae bacterium]